MKIVNIGEENLQAYLQNYLWNFIKIFRKDMPCDNIKSHKKSGLYTSLENKNLEKTQCGDG